ncbi:helix-turn-helix domain-containing protein [Amedibacillus sp. YH-ame10]
MKKKNYIFPEHLKGTEIKRIRMQLHMTQKEFASLLNVDVRTVEKWETKKEPIKGVIVVMIKTLQLYPQIIEKVRIPDMEYPLRLFFMHHEDICTIIDIDEQNHKVKVVNYNPSFIYSAFGNNHNPNYEDYLEFLKSRCFPSERNHMKAILKDLDLPFYDPYLIIEKTEGRMAEDDFWIKIERM